MKNVSGWQMMLQKGVFILMTTDSACIAGRNNIKKMNIIRSLWYEICTEEINKIAITSDDDNRVIMADGIHTLAYGHTILKNYN